MTRAERSHRARNAVRGSGSPSGSHRDYQLLLERAARVHASVMRTATWTTASARVEPAACDHVVVPLDGSAGGEHALAVGEWLAQRMGAQLELLTVADSTDGLRAAERYLATVGATLRSAKPTTSAVVGGQPATVIGARVGEFAPGVVCMATHGRGRTAGVLLGSVARAVLATAPQPTVLVGPHARPRSWGGPVVVAATDRLVQPALATGASWALALGTGLEVVVVADRADHSIGLPEAFALAEKYQPVLDVRTTVLHEQSPLRAVPEHADRVGASLVIAASSGAGSGSGSGSGAGSGSGNLVQHTGLTARLVEESSVPVLVVPAPGSSAS